jgi:hypothetical protein
MKRRQKTKVTRKKEKGERRKEKVIKTRVIDKERTGTDN